jgi:ribosome biogenesis GTPase
LINLADYGFAEGAEPEDNSVIPARVTAVYRERYALICRYGETYGQLKAGVYYGEGTESFPTAGDFVLIEYQDSGDSRIVRTLPRRSFFRRHDPTPGRGAQAVAANFDFVFILMSLNNNYNIRRLERYLALAFESGAMPVVVLTKADLAENTVTSVREAEAAAPGVPVHAVSVRTGEGLGALSKYLAPGKTLVFLGSSGVGKSSLLNALAGEALMAVGDIREEDGRGRHTTTTRQLLLLPCGAMVIDTPGMRELGMWDVHEGLDSTFADVEAVLGRCRFSDCRHGSEPGCAVREAIAAGELSGERWESFQKLQKEARFADDKAAAMREKEAWCKSIAKYQRQLERESW